MATGLESITHPLMSTLRDFPLLSLLIAYILGSLPFAVWVGRWKGNDPRTGGSKNPGASNVARTLGLKWGIFTLVLDSLKGALATWITFSIVGEGWGAVAGIFAVLGHCTSPFLGFRGGRGVATTAGALLILHPGLAGVSIFGWLSVLFVSKKPALASLSMAGALVVLSHSIGVPDHVRIFSVSASTVIIIRHWAHLIKIINGAHKNKVSPLQNHAKLKRNTRRKRKN